MKTWALRACLLAPLFSLHAEAADVLPLDKHGFDLTGQAVVIFQVNWGRYWPCGKFENAQLQALAFSRMPADAGNSPTLALKPKSELFVDNDFLGQAYVLPPGEYALSSYDVKRAISAGDISHHVPSVKELVPDGKPLGGAFSVSAGEIVYIGSFGLDCTNEPMPWRYYKGTRVHFEKFVTDFRKEYPSVKDIPVIFRLFETDNFGERYSLDDPIVK